MPITFEALSSVPPDEVSIGGRVGCRGEIQGLLTSSGGVANGFLGIQGQVKIESDLGVANPRVPAHISGAIYARGGAQVSLVASLVIGGGVPVRGYSAPGSAIEGGLSIGGRVSQVEAADDLLIYHNEDQPIIVCYAGVAYAQVAESLIFDSQSRRLYTAVVRSPLALQSTAPGSAYNGGLRAKEKLALGGRPSFVIRVLAESGISFSSLAAGSYQMLARAVSRLLLTGHAANYAEAVQQVADALAFADLVQWLQLGGSSDALVLGDRLDTAYAAFAEVVERLVLSAKAESEFTLTVLLREGFAVGTSAGHQEELVAQLHDSIGFAMSLSFDDGEFIAWVMNTDVRGLTRYTNYPFNSFARIGGKSYGAYAGGIARLDGADDMGQPIKAKLRLGMFDFGDRHLKSFSDVFFGMSASGQMLLKAIFVDEETGEKNMAIYKVLARPASAARETRAKLGRGMKAVDWDFELENVDGADFDLQSIQFYPTQLTRRTRG